MPQSQFLCNICGHTNVMSPAALDREAASCRKCGSNVRFRAIVDALSTRLFGHSMPMEIFSRKPLLGAGMSDSDVYARRLAERFSYVNTYYHTEPRLDITRPTPEQIGKHDFVITSDVFEHVAPPVQKAFDNLQAILKPGGVVIFSVPFSLEADTQEHYPELFDWRVVETGGNFVLENRTVDGREQRFDNLVFHGGPGTTLEMRLFSKSALERHFAAAGFTDVCTHSEGNAAFGVFWPHPWSIVMSAVAGARSA
jgi:SAM-dependent methyltransferase